MGFPQVFTFVTGPRASLVQALSSLKGAQGFYSPLPSHARWTPWSVLQDGTIETMHLTGDPPASACRGNITPLRSTAHPVSTERQALLGTFCPKKGCLAPNVPEV